jgi:hypothetical protein
MEQGPSQQAAVIAAFQSLKHNAHTVGFLFAMGKRNAESQELIPEFYHLPCNPKFVVIPAQGGPEQKLTLYLSTEQDVSNQRDEAGHDPIIARYDIETAIPQNGEHIEPKYVPSMNPVLSPGATRVLNELVIQQFQKWQNQYFGIDCNFQTLLKMGQENAKGSRLSASELEGNPLFVVVPLVRNGNLELQLIKKETAFAGHFKPGTEAADAAIVDICICANCKRPVIKKAITPDGEHVDHNDGSSQADQDDSTINKTDTCLLISVIARAALLEIDQQIRRICGNDSRLAGLTGASLAASRIISDACRTAKDLNTCNRSLKDAASGNKILYANKAAWMAADGADFLEKGYLLLFGGNQNVKQINKNKKAQYFDDEEEDDDTDDDDLDRGMTKHKDGDVEKTNKLSSALSALTPTLEALLILYMTGLQEKNGYATSIPVPNIITRNLEYLLGFIRAEEMYFTSDSSSYKKKLACLLGCMAIASAIFNELKGKGFKFGAQPTLIDSQD